MPPPTIAYIARHKLHVCDASEKPREIESDFGRQFLERQMRDIEQHGWKGRSGVWAGMGMAPPSLAQWQEAGGPTLVQPKTIALSRGPQPGQLLYALDLGNVGGLFSYDLGKKSERRLMHKEGFAPKNLAVHPTTSVFALALEREHGAIRLATSEQEGRYLTTVTSGDCTDAAPAWLADKPRHLVFQSAGIGRSEHGVPLGLGPFAIREVDLDSGDITTVAESPDHDYLFPRYDASGGLWFIRRPYEQPGNKPVNFLDLLLDIVLFPFRFLRGLFYFFNFFSMMFSGAPLATSAGRRDLNSQEQLAYSLWGQMIDTKKILSERRRGKDTSMVPMTWKLVRRSKEGQEEVRGTNVLTFDLTSDGGVVYSDGFAVHYLAADGTKTKVCSDELIQQLVVVE